MSAYPGTSSLGTFFWSQSTRPCWKVAVEEVLPITCLTSETEPDPAQSLGFSTETLQELLSSYCWYLCVGRGTAGARVLLEFGDCVCPEVPGGKQLSHNSRRSSFLALGVVHQAVLGLNALRNSGRVRLRTS